MGDKNTETETQEQETPQEEMNRFAGASYIDGQLQTAPKPTAADKAKPAKAAKAAPAADDDDDDDNGESAGGADKGDKGGKHRSAQDRIDRAVGKQRAAERERDELRRSNSALEQRLANIEARLTPGGGGAKPDKQEDQPPDATKYEGGEIDPRYIKDLARYEARQATKELREESSKSAQTQQQREAAAEFSRRVEAFTEKATEEYDDFAEIVFDDSNKFSSTLVELSLESEFGAQIAYELALDPKEQRRLAALSPAKQAVWFGRREAELSSQAGDADEQDEEAAAQAAEEAAAKARPKAPPPPKHQTRGTGGQSQVSAATTDFAAFERMAVGSRRRQ